MKTTSKTKSVRQYFFGCTNENEKKKKEVQSIRAAVQSLIKGEESRGFSDGVLKYLLTFFSFQILFLCSSLSKSHQFLVDFVSFFYFFYSFDVCVFVCVCLLNVAAYFAYFRYYFQQDQAECNSEYEIIPKIGLHFFEFSNSSTKRKKEEEDEDKVIHMHEKLFYLATFSDIIYMFMIIISAQLMIRMETKRIIFVHHGMDDEPYCTTNFVAPSTIRGVQSMISRTKQILVGTLLYYYYYYDSISLAKC